MIRKTRGSIQENNYQHTYTRTKMERMNSFDATRMYANARRSITCTRAHVHRQSGVTDITARDLVLEINTHLLYNITEVQNLVATSALATLVHFAATRFLLFGNVHASFLFISTHAVPVQLFKVPTFVCVERG